GRRMLAKPGWSRQAESGAKSGEQRAESKEQIPKQSPFVTLCSSLFALRSSLVAFGLTRKAGSATRRHLSTGGATLTPVSRGCGSTERPAPGGNRRRRGETVKKTLFVMAALAATAG